ncbi:hypothetical protein [Glacieibacterium sp.]|uniref:hypothetical protein n=1 Tax=Glacieibacterium sp. TaxID=2860237 RepID=UPI003B0079AD
MSANITRRALFSDAAKVAAVATLGGVPEIANARPDRSTWEAAVARLEAANAAQNAYYSAVNNPAEAAWKAGKREMPEFAMPADYGPDPERGKPTVWSVATLRTFADPKYDPAVSSLAMFAREKLPEIEAIEAHNDELFERLFMQEKTDEFDRLVDVWCERRDDVFAIPAPDWAALVYKLRLLAQHDHLASETAEDDPLPLITADAVRLAASGTTRH